MCGIAGIIRYSGKPIEQIQKMNQAMIHRGPDAGDYYLEENDRVVLGHRRLSIVDLSENGAQPMQSRSGRYVICFNGEIYNYSELQIKMESEGKHLNLRGSSDTEVMLEAFEYYGIEKTLSQMKGMFAIALWDRQDKKIYLMRDRVGEKPLYFGMVKGSFVFASDLGCMKALPEFEQKINTDVLDLYMQYGYIPAPYTIFRDMYKLEPGKYLTLDVHSLEYQIQTYWDMKQVALAGEKNLFTGSEQEATEELKKLLLDAVKGQMVADVPLGAFLSGGIDSSMVVSLMQAQSMEKVKTFTIGFNAEGYNEAEYAREIAKILGTEHTELYVTQEDAFDVMQNMQKAFTEPFADSSQIPTMLVSKMTREHVTVSLSGDGGDELFCGYNTYRVAKEEMCKLQEKFRRIPNGLERGLGKIAGQLAGPNSKMLYKMGDYFTINSIEDDIARSGLQDRRTLYLSNQHAQQNRNNIAYGKHHLRPCSNSLYKPGLLQEEEQNMMLMDMLQYHPDDILVKVDRAGMFYSLETRIPLLDRDVVEFAWRLPLQYKMSPNEQGQMITKRVMRNILYQYVPQELMERPKKGFSVPLADWMKQGAMRIWAEDILHDGRKKLGEYLNLKLIDQMWKEYTDQGIWNDKLWNALVLEQWMLEQ